MEISRSTSSGSAEFDLLRDKVRSERQLRNDIENLMLLVVETYNPSDRGVRFITGGIGEWILALAAYSAGVVSMPAGHNADGFDLQGVLSQSRSLWSAKGSNSTSREFRISNGLGGAGAGFSHATVFWSPLLPGFVYVDPKQHVQVADAQKKKSDATVLPMAAVADHSSAHPECVIELKIPMNPGTASLDPAFEALKVLIAGGNFPRLRKMLEDASKVDSSLVEQLHTLQGMRQLGQLSDEQFDAAVRKLTS